MAERRQIRISGMVQGVGFRPFVYSLAERYDLGGFVRNHAGEVQVEVEGDPADLEGFLEELVGTPPPLARIENYSSRHLPSIGSKEFHIHESEADPTGEIFIPADVATCSDCLKELLDPQDRRHGYPFLNCTNCGPRLTIIRGAPYDRSRTTMATFPMCDACRKEYHDPGNRRFHAQPTACADCGPALMLLDAAGQPIKCDDPLAAFARALQAGRIGALKGLGGYHLACDATNEPVVQELRRRKQRDEKPLAVMLSGLAEVEALCEVSSLERELLTSRRAPIVLLRRHVRAEKKDIFSPRSGAADPIAASVAFKNPFLGVLLPYTPLHHLLVRAVQDLPLVMTSGNRADEPMACTEEEAVTRLRGVTDLFLVHNRPIYVRCDDSVTRVVNGCESPVRRSRGEAPQPVGLPLECPVPILALGGQLKSTFALGRGRQAFVSHHLGDLDHYEASRAFERDVALYQQLLGIRPDVLAHDLHPDYASTHYVQRRGGGIRLVAVQHHHAHMAACMAEHGLHGPVIGVTWDGAGYGTDGAIWGGEFLVGEYHQFRRAAHLRYVGLPGGDRAIREPWRMAVAHLLDAEAELTVLEDRVPAGSLGIMRRMLQRNVNTPRTSSMGRLFDAVAVIAGLREQVNYEGQAAQELEWLATETEPQGAYVWRLCETSASHGSDTVQARPLSIDVRPLIQGVASDALQGVAPRVIARKFHSTLVDMIREVCGRLRTQTGLETVVLSGGVFLNSLVMQETVQRLQLDGFDVRRHRVVPTNDGGLSLGQLAVAAAALRTAGNS